MPRRIAVLAGGVGAARFLEGLVRVVPQSEVTVVVNTADDFELHGLSISPDLDTVMYTLAGLHDPLQGWGRREETFQCLEALRTFSEETWFRLGDRDLATHLRRTELLRGGATLAEATIELSAALGVEAEILPMTNDRVRTFVETARGVLDFQTYFVKFGARDAVGNIEVRGASAAGAGPGVVEAIEQAELVIVAPSNPLISIGPILAVPGVRQALRDRGGRTVAVSPVVAGRALKGPTIAMIEGMGLEPSALQVARLYQDFVTHFVLDEADSETAPEVSGLGLQAVVAPTVMSSLTAKEALARTCLVEAYSRVGQ